MSARTFGQAKMSNRSSTHGQLTQMSWQAYSTYGEKDEREDAKCVAEALCLCAPPKAGLRETNNF